MGTRWAGTDTERLHRREEFYWTALEQSVIQANSCCLGVGGGTQNFENIIIIPTIIKDTSCYYRAFTSPDPVPGTQEVGAAPSSLLCVPLRPDHGDLVFRPHLSRPPQCIRRLCRGVRVSGSGAATQEQSILGPVGPPGPAIHRFLLSEHLARPVLGQSGSPRSHLCCPGGQQSKGERGFLQRRGNWALLPAVPWEPCVPREAPWGRGPHHAAQPDVPPA